LKKAYGIEPGSIGGREYSLDEADFVEKDNNVNYNQKD